MFRKFVKYLSLRTLRALASIVMLCILLFFAATRTQYGRDSLSRQFEQTFSNSYAGSLRIGKLTGNLLNTLYATDVELLDPSGSQVVHLDSVIIEPRWIDIFQKRFSVGNIKLIRPIVHATYGEDGSLGLVLALRSSEPETNGQRETSDDATGWSFQSATLRIVDGTVISNNIGALPEAVSSGKVFDYTNASLDKFDLDARIDWLEPTRVLDVVHFSTDLYAGRVLNLTGQTQLLLDDERLVLNNFALSVGQTSLSANAWFASDDSVSLDRWNEIPFEMDVKAGRLDFDELTTLAPGLPLGDAAMASFSIRGPVSALTVTSLLLEADDTASVELSGTVSGLPGPAEFEMSLKSSRLTPDRLQTWLPRSRIREMMTMRSLEISSRVSGLLAINAGVADVDGSGTAEIRSSRGTLSISFDLDGPLNDSLKYDLGISTSGVNLAYWTGNPDLRSILNGSIQLSGLGFSQTPAFVTLTSRFTDFRLGNFFLPEFTFSGEADTLSFHGSLAAIQTGGGLTADLHGEFSSSDPFFGLGVDGKNFDIGNLLSLSDIRTALNFGAEMSGTGLTLDRFAGYLDIAMDSSLVVSGGRSSSIVPHQINFVVRDSLSQDPRLTVRGDVMDLDMEQNMSFTLLRTVGSAWVQNTLAAVKRAGDKPLYADRVPDETNDDLVENLRWESILDAMEFGKISFPLRVAVQARVHRADILTSYFPGFPTLSTSGDMSISAEWGKGSMTMNAEYRADSLVTGALHLAHTDMAAHFSASLDPVIDQTAVISLEVSSDSLKIGGQQVLGPTLEFAYKNSNGTIRIATPGSGPVDSLLVEASLVVLPDRARLHFDTIRAQAGSTYWNSSGTSDIEWYSDALLVRDIQLIQHTKSGATGQSFSADGTVSRFVSDTLRVDAHEVVLHELSNFAAFKPHFGGLLNARLAITRTENRSTVTGTVDVDRLSLDSRIIGDLYIESILIPGSADIGVTMNLQPVGASTEKLIYGTELPAEIVENRLDVQGTFRFPGNDDTGIPNEGRLNLNVDIDRADLFFFEYIFSELDNVTGYVSGDGRIVGTMRNPVFDVSLGMHEGHFEIPFTNLVYELGGDIGIDADAIRVRSGMISDPAGGTAALSGSLLFNDYRFFTLDLAATLREFQIMNVGVSNDLPFYGFLWASGDVSIQGPLFNAVMRSSNAVMTANSELFIPVSESATATDDAYIVFEDSLGRIPDFKKLASRSFLLASRPDAERRFLDALDMELSIVAPEGSLLHLVIDPLLGDVINARSSGRLQLQRTAGEFFIYGTLEVAGGDYMFTAGEVFVRKFLIDPGGTITWNGDPINAALDIPASYRTRASTAGLTESSSTSGLIPLIVSLDITGTVDSPEVALGLAIDRSNQSALGDYQAIEARLNAPDRASEYATSVLLTNSFQLTTENVSRNTGGQLAFNSVSQLVSTQLNRFVNEAIPNVDFTFGLQGESAQDLDVTYGVALRLLDEKLIIRGQGLYQGSSTQTSPDGSTSSVYDGMQGEFVVEVKLSPNVSVEAFYRREGDIMNGATLTDTSGAGISYRTEFSSWKRFWNRLFGWLARFDLEPKTEAPLTIITE